MRERPPVTVSKEAGHALCLLTKHQLIDLVVVLVKGKQYLTAREVLQQIEEAAAPVLRMRNERCPKLEREYERMIDPELRPKRVSEAPVMPGPRLYEGVG